MKKILILIFLFYSSFLTIGCNSRRIASQLPESGWSRQHVMKFLEGKYKFTLVDTTNGLGGETVIEYKFAPVSFYGIEGIFSIAYDDHDSAYSAKWNRSARKPWEVLWPPDTILQKSLNSKLTPNQINYLLDTLSKEKGSPHKKKYDTGQIEYTWEEDDRGNMLGITKDGDVFYLLYWENGKRP